VAGITTSPGEAVSGITICSDDGAAAATDGVRGTDGGTGRTEHTWVESEDAESLTEFATCGHG
jgi:hypothetical protein